MNIPIQLLERADNKCELCSNTDNLSTYAVGPDFSDAFDKNIVVCDTCKTQLDERENLDTNHWRCLSDSMWNPNPAVQVTVYRMLHYLSAEDWAQDAMEMMYMEDDTKTWALSGINAEESKVVHNDSNGQVLLAGDTVVLIKDLDVKGANFTAKRGTSVRRIRLVDGNAEQIEGKVNDQNIVILTQFVKKA